MAVPFSHAVLRLLERAAAGRPATEPLLMRAVVKTGGSVVRRAWAHSQQVPFMQRFSRAALGEEIEFGTFRHSFICGALARGTPVRLVAATCDTSSEMIERNYSWTLPQA